MWNLIERNDSYVSRIFSCFLLKKSIAEQEQIFVRLLEIQHRNPKKRSRAKVLNHRFSN